MNKLIKPTISVFTKTDCSLCVVAKDALKVFQAKRPDLPFTIEEIDISRPEHKKWFDLYQFDIPVMHLNGDHFMKHRVNEKVLEEKLQQDKINKNKS